jgi:hypothetical protein
MVQKDDERGGANMETLMVAAILLIADNDDRTDPVPWQAHTELRSDRMPYWPPGYMQGCTGPRCAITKCEQELNKSGQVKPQWALRDCFTPDVH